MAKVLVTDTYLSNIAGAIRNKLGVQTTYTPPEMAGAIASIPTGSEPVLQSKTVTENGTVTPDAGYDGLSSVIVTVSGGGGDINNTMLLSPANATSYGIVNGRVITGFNASYGFVAPAGSSGWMDVDWSGAWEIGVAFKVNDTNGNFALFGNQSTTTDYSSVPSIELMGADLAYGISARANDWDVFEWVKQSLLANTWYFVTMSYDPATMVATARITTDFSHYDQAAYTMNAAPYHNANRKIGFGGLTKNASHTKAGAHIDLYNTYIKISDNIVWGGFNGAFPE